MKYKMKKKEQKNKNNIKSYQLYEFFKVNSSLENDYFEENK